MAGSPSFRDAWRYGMVRRVKTSGCTFAGKVQQKKELITKKEKTKPTLYYVLATDICGNADDLTGMLEIAGTDKSEVAAKVEGDVLNVEVRNRYPEVSGTRTALHGESGNFAWSFAPPRD